MPMVQKKKKISTITVANAVLMVVFQRSVIPVVKTAGTKNQKAANGVIEERF